MPEALAAQHVEEKQEKAEKAVAPKPALSFMPTSWDDAYRIAMYLKQTGLVPDGLRNKEYDILYIVATGAEFGLSPIQALREIAIVKGKPYLSALLRIGMVKRSPECEFFRLVESDDKKATFETKRKGEGVTKLTYSLEDAKRAGLYGRVDKDGKLLDDNWNKSPALMLRRRCGSQLADEVYPDVTRGSYDREELDEEKERELNPAPLRAIGLTVAPPPPAEAEMVESKPEPKQEAPKDVPEAREMSAFDKACAALMECQSADDVDKLSMNTDQSKFTKGERDALGKLFRDRRSALGKK